METGAVDLFSASVYNCSKSYVFVNTGCGVADEHTERSAVAEWDAAFRSAHRAFC